MFFLFTCFLLTANTNNAESKHFPKQRFDVSKVDRYSSKVLLEYLPVDSLNWQYYTYHLDTMEMQYRIVDELVKRKETDLLIRVFKNPKDEAQQEYVALALCYLDDDKIEPVFSNYISDTTTRTMYFCLKYLAKRGDIRALKILNDHFHQYPVSSADWAEIVQYFGKYKYEPAIPNIIACLDTFSLNLVDAAQQAIEHFFTGPYPEFKSLEQMQAYFQKRYEESLKK